MCKQTPGEVRAPGGGGLASRQDWPSSERLGDSGGPPELAHADEAGAESAVGGAPNSIAEASVGPSGESKLNEAMGSLTTYACL